MKYSVTIDIEQDSDYLFIDNLRSRGGFTTPAHVSVAPYITIQASEEFADFRKHLSKIAKRHCYFDVRFRQTNQHESFTESYVAVPIYRGGHLETIWTSVNS